MSCWGNAWAIRGIVNLLSSFLAPEWHFLGIYLRARPIGGTLAPGDDLEVVSWFPLRGPLPKMAFEFESVFICVICAPMVPPLAPQDKLLQSKRQVDPMAHDARRVTPYVSHQ